MSAETGCMPIEQFAAIEAMTELHETRDAYLAMEAMLQGKQPQEIMIDRGLLGSMLRLLNARLASDLARAEAAVKTAFVGVSQAV